MVVLDNLAARKSLPPTRSGVAGVREAIAALGASLLYLPPDSPDLNPIEQVFAKLEALLRKAAVRSRDALWTTLRGPPDAFTPAEGRNHLTHAGHAFV